MSVAGGSYGRAIYGNATSLYGFGIVDGTGTWTTSGGGQPVVVVAGTPTWTTSAGGQPVAVVSGSPTWITSARGSPEGVVSGSGTWVTSGSGTVAAFYRLNNAKYATVTLVAGAIMTDVTGKPVTGSYNTSGENGSAPHILQDAAGNIVQVDDTIYSASYVTDANGKIRTRSHHYTMLPYDPAGEVSGALSGIYAGGRPGFIVWDLQGGQVVDFVTADQLTSQYELLPNLAYSE